VSLHTTSSHIPVQLLLRAAHSNHSVFKDDDASFFEQKPLSSLQNRQGPLLSLRLRFLSFFNGALIQKFNRMVKIEVLITGDQQLGDVSSILLSNGCFELKILELELHGRKCGKSKPGDD